MPLPKYAIPAGVIVAITLAAIVIIITQTPNTTADISQKTIATDIANPSSIVSTPSVTPSPQTAPSTLADGQYQAATSFTTPAGPHPTKLKVGLKNGIIETVDFSVETDNSVSLELTKAFNNEYKGQVIGKSITGLKLDKIAGASLTTAAFNEALAQLKPDAV